MHELLENGEEKRRLFPTFHLQQVTRSRWSSYVNTSKYESCWMDGSSVTSLTAFSLWTWWKLCGSQGTSSLPKWLEKKRQRYHQRTEENVLSLVSDMFCLFPLADSGEWELYLFNLLMCLRYTLPPPPPIHTHSNCRAIAGLDKSQSLLLRNTSGWNTPKLQDLWCYAVSHPYGSLPPQACQVAELSPLWWVAIVSLVARTGHYAGDGSEKREVGDFLINELGSLMGPSKAHVIRRELLFSEALLSQHKNICAFQQRAINALPCFFQAAFPELKGFDSCGFQSHLWTSPRKWYLQLKLHCPFLCLHIIRTTPLLANFFMSSLKYLNACKCCAVISLLWLLRKILNTWLF